MNFDFNKDYVLENDMVLLKPLHESHIPKLLNIANEPNIWDYSFIKGDGLQNLTNYILSTLQARKNKREYPFLVIDKRINAVAGCTRFCDINLILNNTRLGYTWYGKRFQGTGLNKNCKYLLFEFAFNVMKMERIGLGAYIENKRSIAAMKSVGCVQEGKYRKALPSPTGTGRTDAILLSILKEEWIASKKEALKRKLI
ncbi:GNAT family protein [uncultured Lacinutrix sp.]|uniref:GNAT family N-acetyltransferase n=1 Tax=uncultured Lacinutrix sp. TaxID=574032 RepID=UPI002624E9E8|nr:GNAT family protein [uncultured Lacinutrix sp.]